MTQNPYAASHFSQSPSSGAPFPPEARTSALAVVSLILGILAIPTCCILGAPLGVLAAIFGGIALIKIGSSQGLLEGRGLAIGGIVTGTIGLILQVAIWVGGAQVLGVANTEFSKMLSVVESGDPTAVKKVISQGAMAQLDDAKLKAFRDAYQKQVGSFQRLKPGLGAFTTAIRELMANERSLQQIQAMGNAQPYPALGEFSNGEALVLFVVPQGSRAGGPQSTPMLENVIIVPKGTTSPIWLIPPASSPTPPPSGNP